MSLRFTCCVTSDTTWGAKVFIVRLGSDTAMVFHLRHGADRGKLNLSCQRNHRQPYLYYFVQRWDIFETVVKLAVRNNAHLVLGIDLAWMGYKTETSDGWVAEVGSTPWHHAWHPRKNADKSADLWKPFRQDFSQPTWFVAGQQIWLHRQSSGRHR